MIARSFNIDLFRGHVRGAIGLKTYSRNGDHEPHEAIQPSAYVSIVDIPAPKRFTFMGAPEKPVQERVWKYDLLAPGGKAYGHFNPLDSMAAYLGIEAPNAESVRTRTYDAVRWVTETFKWTKTT